MKSFVSGLLILEVVLLATTLAYVIDDDLGKSQCSGGKKGIFSLVFNL